MHWLHLYRKWSIASIRYGTSIIHGELNANNNLYIKLWMHEDGFLINRKSGLGMCASAWALLRIRGLKREGMMNGMELLLAKKWQSALLLTLSHFFPLVLDIRGGIYWQEQGASIV